MRDLFIDPELWRDKSERLRIAVVFDADGPAAFATFKRTLNWDNGEPGGDLSFWTWAAATAASERRLFAVVSDLDLISKVKARNIAPDAPLTQLVKDVRSAHFALRDNLWVRILDIPKALAARTYAADADVSSRSPTSSSRRTTACGSSASAAATRRGKGRRTAHADVTMSMQELSAAYLGGVKFSTLANAGLVAGRPTLSRTCLPRSQAT